MGAELLARARALVPTLRERAARTEAARSVLPETIADMAAAGLFKAVQPRRYGGYEIELQELMAIIGELGRGCGSSAWVYGVFSDHQITLGMFPPQAQDDLWGSQPGALVSSGLAPSGQVEPVEGGLRIRGRWSFSSGVDHADWIFVQTVVPPGPRNERPEPSYVLLPRSDYTIIDTWHVIGLCGTGSKDVEIHDAFVPTHRCVRIADINAAGKAPGLACNDGPLYRLPRAPAVPFCLGAPSIGIAQAMYEDFVSGMRSRASRGFQLAEQATIQVRVAEAAAEIELARMLIERDCRETMQAIRANGDLTIEEKARNRRDMAYVVKLCAQAADRLFSATGGAGLYTNTDMQRMYRDVLAISRHYINSWDISATIYGRVAFGLPPNHPSI